MQSLVRPRPLGMKLQPLGASSQGAAQIPGQLQLVEPQPLQRQLPCTRTQLPAVGAS